MTRIIAVVAGALSLVGSPAAASAAEFEGEAVPAPIRAPRRAFELGADLGYTQGFGPLDGARGVRDVAGAGLGVGVALGYRATPTVSVGARGQFQGYNASPDLPTGTSVRGASVGVEATFHTAPYDRADPWISVGGGYRLLWEVPESDAPAMMTHGFELARVALGLDVRASQDIALAPTVGVGLDVFGWQGVGGGETVGVSSGVSTFLFLGVSGRFDVGGARQAKPIVR